VGVVGGRVMLPVPALPGQKLGQISIGFGFVLYNFVGVVNSGTLLSVIAMNARSFIADAGEYLRSGVRYVRNLRPATAV